MMAGLARGEAEGVLVLHKFKGSPIRKNVTRVIAFLILIWCVELLPIFIIVVFLLLFTRNISLPIQLTEEKEKEKLWTSGFFC